ncbi:MAG: thiosulfate oxidation carrier protein SoxY [Acidocella sp. 20-57-95]|nr:MAG: thiosulfate oxidation carrier protein SoxY [Acidocella sp. 20-57-95]
MTAEAEIGFVLSRRMGLTGAVAATLAAFFAPGFKAAHADGAMVMADAAAYPSAAFAQKTQDAAVKAMFNMTATASDQITLDAPDIAENGAVVPVSVSTALPGVTAIAILALGNPNTIAAAYQLPAGTKSAVSSRIKLAKTTDVVALVQAGGKLYSVSKNVKVTLGGCGG